MPRTIMGYVLAFTGLHQAGLAALSIAVFALSAVPLELQRRIVNGLTSKTTVQTILWLAVAYAGVALTEQLLKLLLNMYRGWVAENTVRRLRGVCSVATGPHAASVEGTGMEIAMMVEEVEPIGGFTGIAISQPLLAGGILASVIGYMFVLQPWLALLGLAFFLPQTIVVPMLQAAINRRARDRIVVKRDVSGAMAEGHGTAPQSLVGAIERIFRLNMSIYWFKYAMYLFLNLMHHFSVAVALCVGGWMALEGRIEVGTVVAIVGGLGKLIDPWGDLIDWVREYSVVSVKYRLFAEAAEWLGAVPAGAESRRGDALATT
ncbi:MAG: ABC transporter transmembrane domain-containing protein [Rhodospirillaceae bacterium]